MYSINNCDFLEFVISVGQPLLLLVTGIKKLATLLAVTTNYVILKMAPLPYVVFQHLLPFSCVHNPAVVVGLLYRSSISLFHHH